MDPVTAAVSMGFGILSAIGTSITIYFKLRSANEARVDDAVEKAVKELDSRVALKIQALEIRQDALEKDAVRKEDVVRLESHVLSLVGRLDDLKEYIREQLNK